MHWLALASAILMTAFANLLMKYHAIVVLREGTEFGSGGMAMLVDNRFLLFGLGCLALAFASYAKSLQSLDVSVAYPTMTGSVIILVTFAARMAFGESLPPIKGVGLLAIITGLVLLSR